jgi:predicted nucleic acid-binding protein
VIIVADASVLVGELLRERGRMLISDTELHVAVAEHQWSEAEHELRRRLSILSEKGRITGERRSELEDDIRVLVDVGAIEIIAQDAYRHLETVARRWVPRDPNDWPTVALALLLDAAILTGDHHFLGCGCPTWTVETLLVELTERTK